MSRIESILKTRLKRKSQTCRVFEFFPSTQLCPSCGQKNKLSLNDREYVCSCGFQDDRDVKSAYCIELEGLKQIPTGCREFTLTENPTSTFFDTLSKIDGVKVSKLVR